MRNNLIESDDTPKHPLPAAFERLGIKNVKPSDELTLVLRNGILEASVKRKSGLIQTATMHVGSGGFKAMTEFDPQRMQKDERDALIRDMYSKGGRQSALAKTFGMSQAMISKIVRAE